MPRKYQIKNTILLLISIIGIVSVFLIGPIPQDQSYHQFSDDRYLLSIPNFWNVISNVPFLIVGFLGMFLIIQQRQMGINLKLSNNSFVFFLGIFFTGIGSWYYHLCPTDETLVWDRLPMTISFMAFFSIIIGEFICLKSGKRILLPLVMIGLMSIIYWQMTQSRGNADLRFYALIQFLPLVLIPLILLMYTAERNLKNYFWLILLFYAVAKLFEQADQFVFSANHFISGHTIKHFIAALGPLTFLVFLCKQKSFEKIRLRKIKL